jgi:hypothetical protein
VTAAAWREADRGALGQWLALHATARRLPAGEDARTLAEVALARAMPFAGELPEDAPFVGVHAPTKPRGELLEPWIAAVEAAAGRPESGELLAGGVELGLLGVDPGVDERAANVIAEHYDVGSIQRAMEGIARQALLDPLTAGIAERLADIVAEDHDKRPLLRALCRHQAALAALRERARKHPSLAITSVYLWAAVDRDPAHRPGAARTLLMLDPHSGNDVRALWGEDGPSTAEEHAELLKTYRDGAHPPPELDVRNAQDALMAKPLTEAAADDPLGLELGRLPQHLELPGYCAWYVATQRPGHGRALDAWAQLAARALTARNDERERELTRIAAAELIQPKTLTGYFEAIERLRRAAGEERFDQALGEALSTALAQADDPIELLAITFSIWSKAPDGGQALHDRVLAPAARPYKNRYVEVRGHFGAKRQAEWDAFVDRHGRRRFARGRLFARRR